MVASTLGITQGVEADQLNEFPDLEMHLPPLERMEQLAVENSPFLKYDSANIVSQKYSTRLVRREWQNRIQAFGNLSNGNQGILVQSSVLPTDTRQNSITNGYRYGINVSIPLSDFTNRKLKIKQSEAELDAAMKKKDQTEMQLRRQVASEYNNLITSQKLLKIKSESMENFRMVKQLSEKQFREGTILLEDYARISDLAVKAEADYELAKSNFRIVYQQFEDLIGVKLTTLMKRK